MLFGCMAVYPLVNIVTHHGPNRMIDVHTYMGIVGGSFTLIAQVRSEQKKSPALVFLCIHCCYVQCISSYKMCYLYM
jgi:hypothetical protein